MTQYNGPRRAGTGSTPRPGTGRPSSQPPVRRAAPPQSRPVQSRAPQQRPPQQRPQQRPPQRVPQSAPSGRGVRLPRELVPMIIIGLVVCVCAWYAQLAFPNGFPLETGTKKTINTNEETKVVSEIHSSGPLRINELMSSNQTNLMDMQGNTPDWIEVINIGTSSVNLGGYTLAKSEKASNVFTFPSEELAPGQCVIVFADSELRNTSGEEYHAPFRLSSKGGTLMLFSSAGTAIDSVNYPALSTDTSYAREDRQTWSKCELPTPGYANDSGNVYASGASGSDLGVELSEVVASNTQYVPDENGLYQDYIELHNKSGETVDLSGWFLSDDPDRPKRWQFPAGFTLQPGEYRIVYASGMSRSEMNPPHTSFGLNTEGETITLSDARGNLVDTTSYDLLKADTAWSRGADGNWSKTMPTPGAANN